jgi:fucose 4-O-acetylase-like acetyltransferase
VHGLAGPVYWLLRRWTGYRIYHLLAFVAVLVLIVIGMAIPFWWLGEQAGNFAGVAGVVIVSVAYLYTATLVLLFSAIVVARLVMTRLRKFIRHGGSPPRTSATDRRLSNTHSRGVDDLFT